VIAPFPTTYWDWIRSQADLIDTDGCSAVSGLKVECCLAHDVEYFYAKDSRHAYQLWCEGDYHCWAHAKPIEREEADRRFKVCHQTRSALGRWSVMAQWRWLGVRFGGQDAWDKHRAREREQRVGAEPV
jgi:hypothetical protein